MLVKCCLQLIIELTNLEYFPTVLIMISLKIDNDIIIYNITLERLIQK